MNISYNWLKRYIALNDSAEQVAQILTSIGLEVGKVEKGYLANLIAIKNDRIDFMGKSPIRRLIQYGCTCEKKQNTVYLRID